jgi:hypothetical protein
MTDGYIYRHGSEIAFLLPFNEGLIREKLRRILNPAFNIKASPSCVKLQVVYKKEGSSLFQVGSRKLSFPPIRICSFEEPEIQLAGN